MNVATHAVFRNADGGNHHGNFFLNKVAEIVVSASEKRVAVVKEAKKKAGIE